jgi:AcrR family transcriptional regulator
VSKAAIYYHYRSKDALLHHLIDPLLDAIDACIHDHTTPATSARTARQLLDAYLAVLLAHREVVPLVTTDVAVLNHPRIGPRLRAQNHQLRTLLAAPDTSMSAMVRAEAALGAIWRPLVADPPVGITDTAHRQTLIDAAVATLQPSRHSPDGEPVPATHIGRHAEHP